MALIHDLPEAKTGDLLPTEENKKKRERTALKDLLPDHDEIQTLWEEYASGDTETAHFVKDMDLCDMCLQALKYTEENRNPESLNEFFETAEPQLTTKTGKKLFQTIRTRYITNRQRG